ncbi:cyclase family protein [Haloferax chudinovii]|uniref:Cyclase family protein n=1 Tax=Haloferax chudinovii TaxID=1109010 RepID=A0ABD5XK74_9EURY
MSFVDLSHSFEDEMPGFRMEAEDGTVTEYTAEIEPFFTHDESESFYDGESAFEITEIRFQTSIGTYLDSPYHRYPSGRDIGDPDIDELVLPGVVVDARGLESYEELGVEVLPTDRELTNRAVLFNFGWDEHWDTEQYRSYPYISDALIDRLVDENVGLVGVDTINVDDHRNPSRPAHTRFLDEEIFIVENMTGLDALHGESFRLFAVPIKASQTAAMPIRAFAEFD